MLCSLDELGLTTHDFPYAIEDGIFILGDDCDKTLGKDLKEAIGFNDTTVEFEITSNRPDCLSVLGLAREAAATYGIKRTLKEPSYKGIDGNIDDELSVEIKNPKLCSRYIAGNFVDITNYVMLEYGQPMHAFDLRYVSGSSIIVRNAKQGEKIVTLDGEERTLSEEMLVIADKDKPVAVAGVMGGEYSGIMDDTTTVVFESACFDGASVRKTAKKLGMRSDASSRFEKGLSPKNCYPAIMRAFELVEELGAGEVYNTIIDRDCSDISENPVDFDPEWINNFLGTDIPESDMIEYLQRLDFEIRDGKCYAPFVRIDIECKADIAEEVARIYGYNNIPSTILRGVAEARKTPEQRFIKNVQSSMVSLGLNEIETYSFISPKYFDKISLDKNSGLRDAVTITNPLGEDTSVMRTTIIPSMCETLARNYNYRNMKAMLFELGNEYIKTENGKLPNEPVRLCIGGYDSNGGMDFYSLKGIVEELLNNLSISDYEVESADSKCNFDEYTAFHPGRAAVLKKNDVQFGIFGELHPEVQENYDIGTRTYIAKLNIPEMMALADYDKTYKPLPKYPATTRDLSLVCAVGKTLEKVTLFDVYKGEQIEKGKKSVSYTISMRSHDGTLTDEQADAAIKRVLKALKEIGAELRA